ncbi:MAG: hypothetical protein ABI876_15785 [Bacteroidota bacterium]
MEIAMKFSERKGYSKPLQKLQKEDMTPELRNCLWNILAEEIFNDFFFSRESTSDETGYMYFGKRLWQNYFKRSFSSLPVTPLKLEIEVRRYFFDCEWFKVYDIIEFTIELYPNIIKSLNLVLERELSAHRIVDDIVTDITSKEEIEMLESVLEMNDFPTVREHLARALQLLSNRENPDYRNSVKESISAVESMGRIMAKDESATLGKALKVIEGPNNLHPALTKAFQNLYGYTSDEGGIRHSLTEESNEITVAEAKFFLFSCTSFINYLKSKM